MNRIRTIASLLAVAASSFLASSAHALTNVDIAGVYEGTAVVTLSGGQTITENLRTTFRVNGQSSTKVTVNGNTTKGGGTYRFISEYGVMTEAPDGEGLGFINLQGGNLTLYAVARLSTGEMATEVLTLHLIRKL